MFQILMVFLAVSTITLIFLCLRFACNKKRIIRNGEIKIKFTVIYKEEDSINIRHTDLILEIKYRLLGEEHNKEETAIIINDLVKRQYKIRGFRIKNNTKKTFNEIKNIMEEIKPLLPRLANSEMVDIKYKILETTIPNWPKEIFAKI